MTNTNGTAPDPREALREAHRVEMLAALYIVRDGFDVEALCAADLAATAVGDQALQRDVHQHQAVVLVDLPRLPREVSTEGREVLHLALPDPWRNAAELLHYGGGFTNFDREHAQRRWLDVVCERARSDGASNTADKRKPVTPADVLRTWAQAGPLEHAPTALDKLDAMLGGGPTFGTRVYIVGAPDAGKSLLLVQIADEYLRRGIAVGLLAVDEEPGDITQRLLQRRDWSRRQCERRDPHDLRHMAEQVADLPLRLYDATWPIEAAAEDLSAYARQLGVRAMLGVDSIQTARCALEDQAGSRYEAVTARVQALRAAAEQYQLVAVATSEMSRAAYRSTDPNQRIDELAAGKESGAIEYSARVLLALRSVEGESDLVELRVRKNKLGPIHRPDEQGIALRIDRGRQTLTADAGYTPPTQDAQQSARDSRADRARLTDAARLAVVIARAPARSVRETEDAFIAATRGKVGDRRWRSARATLGAALLECPGPGRRTLLALDGAAMPSEVLLLVPLEHRPMVAAARPPAEEPAP